MVLGTALSLMLYHADRVHSGTEETAARVQQEFRRLEPRIIRTISDSNLVSGLITDAFTFPQFKSLSELPYGLIIYQGDSALIWTNNTIIPVQAQVSFEDAPLFVTEANGSYVLFQHDFPGKIRCIGFLPVQFKYDIKNKYLSNLSTPGISIPEDFEVSSRAFDRGIPVKAADGSPVFFIRPGSRSLITPDFSGWLFLCIAVVMVCSIILLYAGASALALRINRYAGILVFALSLTGLYMLCSALLYNSVFRDTALFDPGYYASVSIAGSAGDLLIKSVLWIAFALFFRNIFPSRLPAGKDTRSRFPAAVVSIVVLYAAFYYTITIFRSLILDSDISFDIHDFFSLNYFSLVGFICIVLILMSFFFLASRLLDLVQHAFPGWRASAGIMLLALVPCFFGEWLLSGTVSAEAATLFSIFLLCRLLQYRMHLPLRSFPVVLLWLIYYSGLSAYIFNGTLDRKNEENERLFAIRKSIEKDPITEYLFNDVETDITHQLAMQFETMGPGQNRVRTGFLNQLSQDFQNNYFKKYIADFFLFSRDSLIAATEPAETVNKNYFIDAIENNGEFTSTGNLYFINDNTGNYYYLAELPFRTDRFGTLTAYVRLVPRKFSSESIYPELLIDDELRTTQSFSNFNYAIYNNHQLTERQGDYSYPLLDIFYTPKGTEYKTLFQNGYEHLVYTVNDSKKVVVSEPRKSWFEPISLFSYLFFFYLLVLVLFLCTDFVLRVLNRKIRFREWINTTLQNKIQTSVISLIIFAFVIMGIATIFYISRQYNESHKERLLNKIQSVQTNIDFLVGDNRRRMPGGPIDMGQIHRLVNRVPELSEIHNMDINIYWPDGDLITSSQPDIFNKGLVSEKMNALAYFKMNCDKETWFIQTEKIGRLSFLSAYVPILDESGETLFYLNMPYFATEQNLRAEISSFMVTLVNVYVLLLVLAGLIALAVSRSITRPLSVIAGKFREIKLGKSNEPIVWKHDDEIGLLVEEYNKMLKELEHSADLLAKSERESAWRDMARQVAHEIKNPLTPMRLSIQHLQRAIETNARNIRELTEKVSSTLLEQIDNLAHIASEFSNFAVMPKTVNENLCLNDILENVTSLFRQHDEAEIELQLPDREVKVYADKNQLLRVFNNLVKNAVQAIPAGREGRISLTLETFDHRALVKVRDNGSGIPDDKKDMVFVPNFTTKSSGMGIGLAMAKNIVESAGGYIWFESAAGVGTTFYVEFPETGEN